VKYDYLNKEDEYRLIKQYQDGDESALAELINFNQLNIMMLVSKFKNPHQSDYDDAIQEANIAFITAIENFDTSTNNRLISYANTIVRNAILRNVIYRETSIHLPESIRRAFRLIKKHNLDEASKEHLVTQDSINAYNTNYVSYDIDDFTYDESLTEFDNDIKVFEDKAFIKRLFKHLTDDEILVLEHRFGLNGKPKLKHKDIGKLIIGDYKYTKRNIKAKSANALLSAMKKIRDLIKLNKI